MEFLGEDLTKRDNAFVIRSMFPESRYRLRMNFNESERGKVIAELANEERHVDDRMSGV